MPGFRQPRLRFTRTTPYTMIVVILALLRQTGFATGSSDISRNQTMHIQEA